MTTVNTGSKRSFVDVDLLPHSRLIDDDRLASRSADEFGDAEAAEIVHDFRNTVAAIAMLSEIMLKEVPKTSAARDAGRNMRLACNDAQALCERMLAQSRGRFDSDGRIDLSNLVTGMAAMLSTCVPHASTLRFDLAADLPSMEFGRVAMRQIVLNLVKNGAEALGDRPGTVTVSTGWIELDDADLQDEKDCGELGPGKHTYLAVSDTGCGIDQETRTRLQKGTCTTKANGSGLGLASVRRLAAARGAHLRIESRVGEGTTVRLVFDQAAACFPRESDKKNRAQ